MAEMSLYAACRIAADIAGVPWARAKLIYGALQHRLGSDGQPLLPLSRGRAVQKAMPVHVARFLIGLAITDDPRLAPDLVVEFGRLGKRPKVPGVKHLSARVEHLYGHTDDTSVHETVEEVMADALHRGWPGWVEGSSDGPESANGPSSGLASIDFEPDETPPGVSCTFWTGQFPLTVRFEHGGSTEEQLERHLRRQVRIDGRLFLKLSRLIPWSTDED